MGKNLHVMRCKMVDTVSYRKVHVLLGWVSFFRLRMRLIELVWKSVLTCKKEIEVGKIWIWVSKVSCHLVRNLAVYSWDYLFLNESWKKHRWFRGIFLGSFRFCVAQKDHRTRTQWPVFWWRFLVDFSPWLKLEPESRIPPILKMKKGKRQP